MPEQSTNKIPKEIDYEYAGKESLSDLISKHFPKQLIPTKRMQTYFGGIFLIVIAIAIIQFPFGTLLSGNADISFNIGYPWHFLELNFGEMDKMPILIGGLLLDLLLYIILAYSVDIATNLILKNPSLKSGKDSKKQPKVFMDIKPKTLVEKVTQKVVEETQQNNHS